MLAPRCDAAFGAGTTIRTAAALDRDRDGLLPTVCGRAAVDTGPAIEEPAAIRKVTAFHGGR